MLKHALKIRELVKKHHELRKTGLNLNASENLASNLIREILASDACRRISYTTMQKLYGGSGYLDEAMDLCTELAKKLFKSDYASIAPLTGNVAVIGALFGLAKHGDVVVTTAHKDGGYPNQIFTRPDFFKTRYFSYIERDMNIDIDKATELIYDVKPKLIMFGATRFLFPHPVMELCKVAEEVGALTFYDGVQVLGLIAGEQFQDPLREGCPILVGGTNKSFPGPHRGIILVNGDAEIFEKIDEVFGGAPYDPFLQSTFDLSSTVAVGVALAEMLEYGKDYAKQLVRNTKALGRALYDEGLNMACPHKDFTESHQVLQIVKDREEGLGVKSKLEKAKIFVDSSIRYSANEVTRLGMKESEMKHIAELVRKVLIDGVESKKVAAEVEEFVKNYQTIHYCFEKISMAYEYFDLSLAFQRKQENS